MERRYLSRFEGFRASARLAVVVLGWSMWGEAPGIARASETADAHLKAEVEVPFDEPIANWDPWEACAYLECAAAGCDCGMACDCGATISPELGLGGNWCGLRDELAGVGWNFRVFDTNFYQGVTSGGLDRTWAFGGKLDYLIDVDGQKSGLWEGLFVGFHAETRYGDDVNDDDGLLTPSNIAMNFPEADSHVTSITGLKVTQMATDNVAFYAGKINTLQEYPLKYSPGIAGNLPGLAGFMNTSLVFNPIVGRTIPYSTFGVGTALMAGGVPFFTLTAFDPQERATEGLEDLYGQGVVIVPDFCLHTQFFNRPGTWNLGGSYSTADYRSVDPAAYLNIPPDVIAAGGPLEDESWALYANGYQAFWVDANDPARNWGVFTQTGLSDGNPNPVSYVVNGGLGGRAMFAERTLDTFGIGYFYVALSNNFKTLAGPFVPLQDERGVEIFYNFAVTPWCRLTYDFQAVEPANATADTTILNGLRLQLIF